MSSNSARASISPWGILLRLVVMAGVSLVFGEGVLRAIDLGHPYFSAPEAYVAKPAPDWRFAPRPGFTGRTEGTWVSINALGLRADELAPEAAPGTTRLLMLGDSVTFGSGVLLDETFTKALERRLAAREPGRRFEAINGGVVGYNTIQEHTLYREVGRQLRPDTVILTFLVNDLLETFSIFDHQYEPSGPLAGMKLWLRRESHLYRLVQNTYWQLVGDARRTGGPAEPQRQRARVEARQAELARLADLVRADGAVFLVALYPDNLNDRLTPGDDDTTPTMREAMLAFGQQSGIVMLDLTDAIGDVRDPRARQMRLREDPHPSPLGHQAIADAFDRFLSEHPTLLPTRSSDGGVRYAHAG